MEPDLVGHEVAELQAPRDLKLLKHAVRRANATEINALGRADALEAKLEHEASLLPKTTARPAKSHAPHEQVRLPYLGGVDSVWQRPSATNAPDGSQDLARRVKERTMRLRLGSIVAATVALVGLLSCQTLSGLDRMRQRGEGGGGQGGEVRTESAAGEGGASGRTRVTGGRSNSGGYANGGGAGGARADEGGAGTGGAQAGGASGASQAGAGTSEGGGAGTAGWDTGGRGVGGSEAAASGSAGTAGSTQGCTMCGNDCVDLNGDADHCGECGRACTMAGVATRTCEDGLCVSKCQEGRGNCNQPPASDPDDGCETDTASNLSHCGGCGRACVTGGEVDEADCVAGRCTSTCKDDSLNLSRPEEPEPDDGCEVVFATNVEHCGAKDRACSSEHVATRTCADRVCTSTCAGGYWNIKLPAAPSADDGCEAPCPATTGGPTMVRMPGGYCIDSTEVTQAQYAAWLDTLGSSWPAQPAECSSWNTSLTPTCDWDPAGRANYPVVCVDWCDAYAYCQGVGKRLCGNRSGGANPYDKWDDAAESQWYAACSSGGVNEYPYAGDWVSNACNGYDYGTVATVEAGTLKSCQAAGGNGYEGVFDLSGNVWEWEDSCDAQVGQSGESVPCRFRGGSFDLYRSLLRCAYDGGSNRDYRTGNVGFRCCAP